MSQRAYDAAATAIREKLPAITAEEAGAIVEVVLLSVRSPTNAMLCAAAKIMSYEHRPTLDWVSSSEKHRLRWQAMIDAALGRNIPYQRKKP